MFGFMRNRECEQGNTLNSNYRLHYCGTCKTMGTLYGQRTRPLLNFDTVFLSELLAVLGNEQPRHWNDSYQAKSCFQLPNNQEDMPLSLQFSATVNVLLAELKTEDNLQDGAGIGAKIVQKLYSTAFQKAEKQMQAWGFDTNLLTKEMSNQALIEKQFDKHTDFAAPTANMTALIFEKGAEVVGNEASRTTMYQFGQAFGEVIYWLDALEDYEKDVENKQFNAIQANYGLKTAELPLFYQKKVIEKLRIKEAEIHTLFHSLPISPEKAATFCQRFSANLAGKLSTQKETENAFVFEWQAIQSFWESRKASALDFAKGRISEVGDLPHQIQLNAWLLAAFIAPNISQHLPSEAPEKHNLSIWAAFAAFFAALGFGKKAVKSCKNGKSLSFVKYLPFQRKKDAAASCCGDCATDCCSQCCQDCCNQCGQACCDSLCNSCCQDMGTVGWIILGMLLLILTIVVIILAV